ncbi:hypothetical protein BDW22DRAFT_1053794 [Trametopsis cervina]|nr:hypothetical protein BDW22DRAFT_1053794 [Trametopsis cervina]
MAPSGVLDFKRRAHHSHPTVESGYKRVISTPAGQLASYCISDTHIQTEIVRLLYSIERGIKRPRLLHCEIRNHHRPKKRRVSRIAIPGSEANPCLPESAVGIQYDTSTVRVNVNENVNVDEWKTPERRARASGACGGEGESAHVGCRCRVVYGWMGGVGCGLRREIVGSFFVREDDGRASGVFGVVCVVCEYAPLHLERRSKASEHRQAYSLYRPSGGWVREPFSCIRSSTANRLCRVDTCTRCTMVPTPRSPRGGGRPCMQNTTCEVTIGTCLM